MKYEISEDRQKLTLTVTAGEQEMLCELPEEGDGNIHSDDTMYEWFEWLIANSELTWINPEETGDLTSAPMLGILGEEQVFRDADSPVPHRVTGPNFIQEIKGRWAWMAYQVQSLLVELRDKGKAELIGGYFE